MLIGIAGVVLAIVAMPALGWGWDLVVPEPEAHGRELLHSDVTKWLATAVVVGYVLVVEGRSLGSLSGGSLAPGWLAATVAGGTVLLLAANPVTQAAADRIGLARPDDEMVGRFADVSVPGRLRVALTAGVTEEVLYRGYVIERVIDLTASPLLAGVVSVVAFVVVHRTGWDTEELPFMLVPAALLTGLYFATRSLPAVVAVHALNDAVGLLLAARFADGDGNGDGNEPATR